MSAGYTTTVKRTGMTFEKRREMAKRLEPSHYSSCDRCLMPWNLVDGHSIAYDRNVGCFPICNECWDELTPQERVPYYLGWLERTDREMAGYDCEKYNTPLRRAMLEINVLADKRDHCFIDGQEVEWCAA